MQLQMAQICLILSATHNYNINGMFEIWSQKQKEIIITQYLEPNFLYTLKLITLKTSHGTYILKTCIHRKH